MKKKNFTRFLAFALVLIQVFTLAFCFTVTTSAEETDATPTADYIFYPTSETMTLDGKGDEKIWSNVPASSFLLGNATLKGTYTNDGTTTKLYILVEYIDNDGDYTHNGATWTHDGFEFVMDAGGTESLDSNDGVSYALSSYRFSRLRTNVQFITGNDFDDVGAINTTTLAWSSHVMHAIQDNRTTNGTVSIEIQYTFQNDLPVNGTFGFNMFLQHNPTEGASGTITGWQQNVFGGAVSTYKTPNGVATGYLATVEPNMLTGAGMRLDTVDNSGLRFETLINKAAYDALNTDGTTVTTGTLIIPTDLMPTTLTKAALIEAGAVDVINDGWANAATADTDGYYQFFGSIVKIKEENLSREFSGISYITVTDANGDSVTYLSNYSATDHSRNVKTVAQAALDSGKYSEYEDILNSYLR